jgi:hypothetical protein
VFVVFGGVVVVACFSAQQFSDIVEFRSKVVLVGEKDADKAKEDGRHKKEYRKEHRKLSFAGFRLAERRYWFEACRRRRRRRIPSRCHCPIVK